jgi:hypothetical protein
MNKTQFPVHPDTPLPTAALTALTLGNKIEAIKILRAERGLGLKEAKDLVDHYVAGQPALGAQMAQAQSESLRSGLFWLAVLAILATLGYFLLAR